MSKKEELPITDEFPTVDLSKYIYPETEIEYIVVDHQKMTVLHKGKRIGVITNKETTVILPEIKVVRMTFLYEGDLPDRRGNVLSGDLRELKTFIEKSFSPE